MKYLPLLIIVVSATSLISKATIAQTGNSLVGTWQLISNSGSVNDTSLINNDSSKIYMLKTITPKRFVFTIYDKETNNLLMSAQALKSRCRQRQKNH